MTARRRRIGLVAAFLLGLGGYVVAYASQTGHRRPPTPSGMVFRVETREMDAPLDRAEVYAVSCDGPAVAIATTGTQDHEASLAIHRYPDGSYVKRLSGSEALRAVAEGPLAKSTVAVTFDLDGDGTSDSIAAGASGNPVFRASGPQDYGVVRVVSGRTDRVLFEDTDLLEYESTDRAIPLGDLDGDGCATGRSIRP